MNPAITRVTRASLWGVAFAITSFPFTAEAAQSEFASTTVRTSDLNLTSEQGITVLYRRISSAADSVCGPALTTGSRIPSSDYLTCVRRAIADAVAKIDRPELTAYYAGKQGHLPSQSLAANKRGLYGG